MRKTFTYMYLLKRPKQLSVLWRNDQLLFMSAQYWTSGCHASLIMFFLHNNVKVLRKTVRLGQHNPNDCAVQGVGLQSLTCWNCRFKSHWGHECLSSVSHVCCQVDVSASDRSLVQSSPTECGVSECDHEAAVMRRPGPLVAVAPWWGGGGEDVKYLNGIEIDPFQLCTAVRITQVNHVFILKVQ
jgi:hypothetical protein